MGMVKYDMPYHYTHMPCSGFVCQHAIGVPMASHPSGQESDSSSESSTSMSSESLDIKTLAIVARWVCCAAS